LKIQYKTALWITLYGVVIVVLLSLGYDNLSHKIVIEKELKNIKSISDQVSLHIESHLKEKATIALTLSSSPTIKQALLKSNLEFASLSEEKRKQNIDSLNKRWMGISDIKDPFIQKHMKNPVAEHLKYQQELLPGEYGEIFLTNRYGKMIATTGKLTTLAHAHKYWWKASYNSGTGKIFFDDRGFDTSVGGYVLGVVIPIRDKKEVIGILKCNVNIMGPLTDVVLKHFQQHSGKMQIARTGGLVVAEKGVPPLSTKIGDTLVGLLSKRDSGITTIVENKEKLLISYSPIALTMGSKQYGFGGKKESIDQYKGNVGEGWHIVISLPEAIAQESAHETTKLVILIGLIFTILTTAAALFLGRKVAKPIVELSKIAQAIGDGDLNSRTKVKSNDEIGSLAKSLNDMAKNLQETMTSRDNLALEIKQRIKAEEEKEKIIGDLEKALEDIKTLSGIVPICSYCKEIRDDNGYWNQLEKYISEHSEVQFSHGICDKCMKKHYPEYKGNS